jgi:lysozyme
MNAQEDRVKRLQARVRYWEKLRKRSMRRSVMLAYLRPRLKQALAKLAKSQRGIEVSERGVRMVAGFEGYSARWYDDGLGNQTIGYGFLKGEWNKPYITEPEALALLRRKLNGEYGDAVRRAANLTGWRLTQNEFDALVSFTFNLGTGWVGNEKWSVWRFFRARNRQGVADSMLLYVNPGSPVEAGLRRRRQAERSLFLRRS